MGKGKGKERRLIGWRYVRVWGFFPSFFLGKGRSRERKFDPFCVIVFKKYFVKCLCVYVSLCVFTCVCVWRVGWRCGRGGVVVRMGPGELKCWERV